MTRRISLVVRMPMVVSWLDCQRQTWESATEAGQQVVQQGNYAEAERILLMAVHEAEKFGLNDRRVSVHLSQLAQVYAGKGMYVETELVSSQLL